MHDDRIPLLAESEEKSIGWIKDYDEN